ncbi:MULTISPECIES: alpha/beta fold hydrolase [Rhodomicrobium]|uniref:alpha/beta hydrolase n=1 Tax=Rhodomicrobium TaxID=1068 RepID=UPI001FD91848|nr:MULTISPECIES: alpha/beta fold hydrolase [Rhodomicrobium]
MTKMPFRFALLMGAALLLSMPCPVRAAEAQSGAVRDLALSGGGTQRVLYARPAAPRGTIVMLPGGAGDLGIEDDGDLAHGKNFVVRTREMWLAHGYAVVIPDALDGENMRGERSSPDYARVIEDLVRFAHKEAPGPVFLLGTSQGSIAAMNGAAHLPKGQIAGVVLTESVTRESKSGETVFDASPGRVTVPALIVANRDSRCRVALAEDAPRIAAALSHAPEAKLLYVEGGEKRSGNCGSQSPHGYFGIESTVVGQIAAWLDAHR